MVLNGGGLPGWRVMGKRVAFSKKGEKPGQFTVGGGYQQYCITDAFQCIPIPDTLSWEQGSMHCVNPMSALGMIENAQEYGTPALIQTAAASQLGQMVNRVCQVKKLPVINIVRRQEHVDDLKAIDAQYIVNSSEEDWKEKLAELIKELKPRYAIECISGEMPGTLLSLMPSRSKLVMYGNLSKSDICEINPLLLIGRD